MAHYAFINADSIVVEVIAGRDEDDLIEGVTDWETYYGNIRGLQCLRTSYNTYYAGETIFDENGEPIGVTETNSQHKEGKTPFRGKFATPGDFYDSATDRFVTP